MRLIDADALLDYFGVTEKCEDCVLQIWQCEVQNYSLMDICNAVCEMPTIQATTEETSVKHGKWVDCGEDIRFVKCSECGKEALCAGECYDYSPRKIFDYAKSNFCPHCGADMREV